jgi:hypothetical protein
VQVADPHLRAVRVKDAAGAIWLILVNFSESPKTVSRAQLGGWLGGEGKAFHSDATRLAPLGIGVWRLLAGR